MVRSLLVKSLVKAKLGLTSPPVTNIYNQVLYAAPKTTEVLPKTAAIGLTSKDPTKQNNSETQFKLPGTPIEQHEAKKNHVLNEGMDAPKPRKYLIILSMVSIIKYTSK